MGGAGGAGASDVVSARERRSRERPRERGEGTRLGEEGTARGGGGLFFCWGRAWGPTPTSRAVAPVVALHRSQSGSAVDPRVEGQVGKGDGPGKGLRLEWQVLRQPFADRQGDNGTAWNGHRFFGLRASTSARAAQARRGLVSEATARPDVASDTLKIAMVDAGRVPKPHLRLSRRLLPPTSDDRGLRRLFGDDRAAAERDFAGRAVERDPVALADLPAVEGR